MIAEMSSASFGTNGRVLVELKTSTINAYTNLVEQYSPYGIMSVPLPTQLVNIEQQSPTQVMMTGFNNAITDSEFSINAGEIATYSQSWYNFTANAGIYMQPVGLSNKENAMMGQSTNGVITDILNLLVEIINYLGTHVHTGVTSGTDESGIAFATPPLPDDSNVIADQTYISDNKNLAITGTYTPH
jgi:hypothetical protein